MLQFLHKRLRVLELTIDRGKAHIGHLIHILEFPHDDFANIARRDLRCERVKHFAAYVFDQFVLHIRRNRALLAGLAHAHANFFRIKRLPSAIPLDNHDRYLLDLLVGRKAFPAVDAFAPAADGAPVLRWARVNHLALDAGAISAFHSGLLLIWCIITYNNTICMDALPERKHSFFRQCADIFPKRIPSAKSARRRVANSVLNGALYKRRTG
ncbi:hypothetical protein SDC9_171653 [bioreactor metagenome]|uniref:Uncharacterized protein n=1 Tax=bioreactor metagenome TaxID=1076179 RepID=A0A645GBF9_9ZZZZ